MTQKRGTRPEKTGGAPPGGGRKQRSGSQRNPREERTSHFERDPGASRTPASKYRENEAKVRSPKVAPG